MFLNPCPRCRGNVPMSARSCLKCGHRGPFNRSAQPQMPVAESPAPAYAEASSGAPLRVETLAPAPVAFAPQPTPQGERECPICRLRALNRNICPRCDDEDAWMVASTHLPPHHFPRVPVDYAGFDRRVGAYLADSLVLLPVTAGALWMQTRSPAGAVLGALLSLIISQAYHIGLIATFGQTAGKRLMGIQVRRSDGAKVGWASSCLRVLPILLVSVIGVVGTVLAAGTLSQPDFDNAGDFLSRFTMLSEAQPFWVLAAAHLASLLSLADRLVLLTNRRRQTLHDYMAGTVVVHT